MAPTVLPAAPGTKDPVSNILKWIWLIVAAAEQTLKQPGCSVAGEPSDRTRSSASLNRGAISG